MSEATCKTCPWGTETEPRWSTDTRTILCRFRAPVENEGGPFPRMSQFDWCGSHPERQPHLECATTTIVGRETFPTESDMRRVVDALEKMATNAMKGCAR